MRIGQRNHGVFKHLPLAVAVVACLYGASAMAQTTVSDDDDDEEEARPRQAVELDRVTVTGSLIKRVEFDSTSPVQVITADTSVTLGQVDTAEFLQQSSVAAGSTQINHQFSGFVIEGGTGVQTLSLRGLGPQRTLVLLNGRRPGPAGTRGQVGAFDLNVVPSTLLQRAEILKDGSSSIYGSDAVAGVVNLITRRDIDKPEFSVGARVPFDSGGEVFTVSGANGWNFGNANLVVAAEWYLHEPLRIGDRDFFRCSEDLVTDQQGNRIDREDRSILRGTPLAGCGNLYANTVIDALRGTRYIPSPDGVTIGLIPGYRPRRNAGYNSPGGQAFYEDVLNFDFYDTQQVIDRQERRSLFASLDLPLGDMNWSTEFLYNNRTTDSHRYRQFFPLTGGATSPIAAFRYPNSPTYVTPVPSGVAQPVMPFPSDQKIEVDYVYINTGLDGLFGQSWSWQTDASYSRSDGEYSSLGIVASRSGDVRFDSTAPRVDYFDPGFLSGARMAELVSTVGQWDTGNTVYDQFVLTGIVTGELFELPAGAVGAAFGAEYRRFSIDDQPGTLSRNGDLWGQSSAQVTKGTDKVKEAFAEIEVPIIKGKPFFESLVFNASGRVFEYDSVDGSDKVWKLGLGWQVTPAFRLRATKGTSYRAPGLFELFLGDQTGFVSQLNIDPCIRYEESTNEFIRANCAALGIPGNFPGGTTSATIISGGGAGVLSPETSRAQTAGIIFTPSFAPISIALDYFDFEVNNEISQLGGGAILGGCYGAPVFPNAFCNLFNRNPGDHPTAPFAITEIRNQYLNVNKQKTRGYDLLFRYDDKFAFGGVQVEGQFTYVFEDIQQLFDSAQADGFNTNDRNGAISRPKVVGNVRTALERGDWTYTWFMDYVHGTRSLFQNPEFTYFGFPGALRDIRAERRLYHTASVRYAAADWSVVAGIRNLFDAEPPTVSTGVATRYGNIPAFATQYDWYGRTAFVRFNYKF